MGVLLFIADKLRHLQSDRSEQVAWRHGGCGAGGVHLLHEVTEGGGDGFSLGHRQFHRIFLVIDGDLFTVAAADVQVVSQIMILAETL